MESRTRYQKRCDVCCKTYAYKHSCSGSAHRPRASQHATKTSFARRLKEGSIIKPSSNSLWGAKHRARCLELPRRLIMDDAYLEAEVIYHQSVSLRLKGNVKDSQCSIEMFRSSLGPHSNGLQHESFTALCVSQATNYMYSFKFTQAHDELRQWMPTAELFKRQEHLLWDHILCVGRLMRGRGYFQEAKTCFETCLETPGLTSSKRLLVKSALADLFCELDYREAEKQMCYLSRAVALVSPEIAQLRLMHARWHKGFRRLLHCLIEAKLRQGYDHDAALLV